MIVACINRPQYLEPLLTICDVVRDDPNYINTRNEIYCPSYEDLRATVQDPKVKSSSIGQLTAASGRILALPPHATEYCLLDWALIQLNSTDIMKIDKKKLKPNFQLQRSSAEVSGKKRIPTSSTNTNSPNILSVSLTRNDHRRKRSFSIRNPM